MDFKHFIFLFILREASGEDEQLHLIKSIRTDYLQNFEGYAYMSIIHFSIPSDTQFASFRFQAEQTSFSIFGCDKDEIILYMKHGSIPVVNPDDSKIPPQFYNASHIKLMYLDFSSDKKYHYINITTPAPGSYYATAFHPYINPDDEAITQSGLSKVCQTYIDASLFIQKSYIVGIGMSGVNIDVTLSQNETQTFKFFIPGGNDRLVIVLRDIDFCDGCTELTARLYSDIAEFSSQGIISIHKNTYKNESIFYHLAAIERTWQYVQLKFTSTKEQYEDQVKIKLQIKSFGAVNREVAYEKYMEKFKTKNLTGLFGDAMYKILANDISSSQMLYKEYDLVRSGKSESFFYQFDLHPKSDGSIPIAVNLTNEDYTMLKFHISEAIDTGGTLNFIIAFVPRITKVGKSIQRTAEPSTHKVVACIRNSIIQLPTWPDKCVDHDLESNSPLILNSTVTNTTVMLPYPEAGIWYVTLKLYCGECSPCKCPKKCVESYQECVSKCEKDCALQDCINCTNSCRTIQLEDPFCSKDCNCDGPCLRDETKCNTSILFDISSFPCVSGTCGKNGRCIFSVTEGIVYSTCLCTNKYKGWDCNDDSNATSYGLLVLEMILLIVSNIGFLPATYFAYKRKYYVEAVVYFSTFLFSSLYHACDAGQNVISFCIVRLGVLQFSDFFSGLLSIWVTMIAMSYLQQPFVSIAHMMGCIILAFGTTFNKTSIWVFVLPSITGLIILIGNWVFIGKRNKCLFPSKKYLTSYFPIGVVIVGAGLLTYALFQTQSNYKYLHSLWHLLMAIGVICLLPDMKVFLPERICPNTMLNAHSE